MPNWCSNTLKINHRNKKKLAILIQAWLDGKFLATILPEPDYTKVKVLPTFPDIVRNNKPVPVSSAWWDWRVQNWGTKWEIEKPTDTDVKVTDKCLEIFFDSAWSPPIGVYQELVRQGFTVKAYYYEGGCAFCGKFTTKGGDQSFNLEGNSAWVKDNIPKDLDEEFNISVNMAQYEDDNKEEEA